MVMPKIRDYETTQKEINENLRKHYLEDKDLTKKQKQILIEFDTYNINRGLKDRSRTRYLQYIRKLALVTKKEFKQITKKDLEKYFAELIKIYNPVTIDGHKIHTKSFFKWLYNIKKKGEYPKLVEWITLRRKNGNKLPEEILTREEVKKLIQVTDNLKEKALIFVFYESAARRSEILGLKLKHVEEDKYGFKIHVSGKTGERVLRLINSAVDLRNWLEVHPYRDDPDSPLWINTHGWTKKTIGTTGIHHVFKKLARRANIKKNVYAHIFRHSRLTHLAQEGFNEMELRHIAGWSKSSDMPEVYIHLSGGDIDKKLLSKEGLLDDVDDSKKEVEKLKIKLCVCGEQNSIVSKYCKKCLRPLDLKDAMRETKAIDVLNVILDDELKELIQKKKQQYKDKIQELLS